MVGAAASGAYLAQLTDCLSHLVCSQPFPWTVCAFSVTSGFAAALVVVICLVDCLWSESVHVAAAFSTSTISDFQPTCEFCFDW